MKTNAFDERGTREETVVVVRVVLVGEEIMTAMDAQDTLHVRRKVASDNDSEISKSGAGTIGAMGSMKPGQ